MSLVVVVVVLLYGRVGVQWIRWIRCGFCGCHLSFFGFRFLLIGTYRLPPPVNLVFGNDPTVSPPSHPHTTTTTQPPQPHNHHNPATTTTIIPVHDTCDRSITSQKIQHLHPIAPRHIPRTYSRFLRSFRTPIHDFCDRSAL